MTGSATWASMLAPPASERWAMKPRMTESKSSATASSRGSRLPASGGRSAQDWSQAPRWTASTAAEEPGVGPGVAPAVQGHPGQVDRPAGAVAHDRPQDLADELTGRGRGVLGEDGCQGLSEPGGAAEPRR